MLLAVPWLRRFERHVQVLHAFSGARLVQVGGLSVLRYAVFASQFVLLLVTVGSVPVGEAFVSVPVVFLAGTLIPTTALTELGVRGSLAGSLVSGGEPVGVVIASMLLWAVNIMVPAVAGCFILLFARIRAGYEST